MQETQQLLDDNKLLYDDVRQLLKDSQDLREALQSKEEMIRVLEQRIADLEHASLTVNGPYIANQQISKQILTVSHPLKVGRKLKNTDSPRQLQLCL